MSVERLKCCSVHLWIAGAKADILVKPIFQVHNLVMPKIFVPQAHWKGERKTCLLDWVYIYAN